MSQCCVECDFWDKEIDMNMPKILGVNTRYYPTQVGIVPPDSQDIGDCSINPPLTVCVLVAGDIGDYAAYVGHGSPVWVARNGDKISFDEACCHFPGGQLQKEKYRS